MATCQPKIRIIGIFGTPEKCVCERLVGHTLSYRDEYNDIAKYVVYCADSMLIGSILNHIEEHKETHGESGGMCVFMRSTPFLNKYRKRYDIFHEIWNITDSVNIEKIKDKFNIDGTNVCSMCGRKHPSHHACIAAVQGAKEVFDNDEDIPERKISLNLVIPSRVKNRMDELQVMVEAESKTEVIRRALSLYDTIVTATHKEKNTVWLKSPDGTLKEIILV